MQDAAASMAAFVAYVGTLEGDEKGEAQVFCDRLFRAFGHEGYKEAGAVLEERGELADGRTKLADLRWGKHLLLEMRKRGERLGSPRAYSQVYEDWLRLAPDKPQYGRDLQFRRVLDLRARPAGRRAFPRSSYGTADLPRYSRRFGLLPRFVS